MAILDHSIKQNLFSALREMEPATPAANVPTKEGRQVETALPGNTCQDKLLLLHCADVALVLLTQWHGFDSRHSQKLF